MSDPLNPAALHVRVVTPHGETEDVCSLASFVANNEHDEIALLRLAQAIVRQQVLGYMVRDGAGAAAHAWHHMGAGGTVGLVIEEGPAP